MILLSITEQIIKAIIVADECGDWRIVLSLCGELNRPMTLARSELRNCERFLPSYVVLTHFHESLLEIDNDRLLYLGRAGSQQHRVIGEEFLEKLVFDTESLDTELLWVCVDHFTASLQSLRPMDNPEGCICHESFAKTCSSLGLVYEKVIKMNEKAHTLYLQTIQHCDIVTHTSGAQFFGKKWYQTAKNGIEAYRFRKEAYDQAEVAKQREPTLIKLKPKLTAIDAAIGKCQGKLYKAHALLVHIYETLPPKKGSITTPLDKNSKEDMKKALLKAVTHYHPDKHYNKEAGVEWLVLCEEITKRLNEYYEHTKN
mmetsp:Transcript_10343/g.15533  ORF Transcript_10343/g.15533 Transcript_10343/m.15533 type:complete len:314 (-) Transcript_10343:1689-2630(-)